MLVNLILRDSKIMGVITSPIRAELPTIEIESLADIKVGFDTFENGKVVHHEEPKAVADRERIIELKKLLSSTDYLCMKHADGALTDEEYAPIKALRQSYRDEINSLEAELSMLN